MRGCEGVYCIGDCNFVEEYPLPASAQVASQQGAYLGRLLSKGFKMGAYAAGTKVVPPYKVVTEPIAEGSADAASESGDSGAGGASLYPSERLGIGSLGVTQEVRICTLVTSRHCGTMSHYNYYICYLPTYLPTYKPK